MNLDQGLHRLKKLLVNTWGPNLRNTVYLPGKTCAVCVGTLLLQAGRRTCAKCDSYEGAADLVGSLIYGGDGLATGDVLYGYKNPGEPRRGNFELLMSGLVGTGFLGHRRCADALAGKPSHQWATVPSLRHIGKPHPFRTILNKWLGPHAAEITVSASRWARNASYRQRRDFNPDLFSIGSPVTAGGHVIVIDDTWVSGSHSQSVALALKRAGAAKVSILTVGRWLDLNDPRTRSVYDKQIEPRPYNPDICPWTASDCPSIPAAQQVVSQPSTRSLPIPFKGFSYDHPGRIGPACRMIADILSDGNWYRWDDITAQVATEFDLQRETISNLLRGMVNTGGIERSPAKTKRGSGTSRVVVRLR